MQRPEAQPPSVRAAVGTGALAVLLTTVLGGIWSGLVIANLATTPALPWAAIAMAAILWVTWRYLDGWGPPRRTSLARRRLLRANSMSTEAFGWALAAGMLSVIALMGGWIVLVQIANPPPRALPDFSTDPALTVATLILMAAVVGAVAEEAGFRGYFQGVLEGLLPAPAAIAVVCLVMAPEHALTQGFVWTSVLFYLIVDTVFGVTAYLTGTIIPGIIVHAIGLALFFLVIWPGDPTRLPAADGGADAMFWLHVGQFVVFGLVALLAFRRLAALKNDRPGTVANHAVA